MDGWFRHMWAVLKQPANTIAAIGIVVAAILAYFGIKDDNTTQTLSAILAILAAVAIADILGAYGLSQTRESVKQMQDAVQRLASAASPPLRQRPQLASLHLRAQTAQDILIIGRSASIVMKESEFFIERIHHGATVRLVVANPHNRPLLKALAPLTAMNEAGFISDLQTGLLLAQHIRERIADPDKMQVRVVNYVPTLSAVSVDSDSLTGHTVIEMVPYRVSPTSRPHLFLTARDNPTWHAYFRDICQTIWDDAEELPDGFDQESND